MIVESLKFRLGANPKSAPLKVNTGTVTVFLGPNNGGKSTALQQVFGFCSGNGTIKEMSVINSISFSPPEPNWAERTLSEITTVPYGDETIPNEQFQMTEIAGKRSPALKIHLLEGLKERHTSPRNASFFGQLWLRHFTRNLDGTMRLSLTNTQNQGDLVRPVDSFASLYTNNKVRAKLWKTIFESIGLHPFMHNTVGGKLGLVLSKNKTDAPERSNDEGTVEHVRASMPIEMASDGIRAFIGLLIETTAGSPKIICIDEPEAFLHPSLCETLGREVCSAAKVGDKQLFIATHSPHFLVGAVQSGADINIVRLTYDNGDGSARTLPEKVLRDFTRVPKFRSVGMLPALFANHVVVTEGDSDKALYEELFTRMSIENPTNSAKNTLFLNARTKGQVKEILEPLRDLGIPTAGIVDLDILREKYSDLLDKIGVPKARHAEFSASRNSAVNILNEKFGKDAKGKQNKWRGGIYELEDDEREAVEPLINSLAEYGLFVVPVGELEDWLSYLDVPKHRKEQFVGDVFEKLGHDPLDKDYQKPRDEDVWEFLRSVETWLKNPHRKGMK